MEIKTRNLKEIWAKQKAENQKIKEEKSRELGYEVDFCEDCDGEGGAIWSCCGDNITGNDLDICPTCYEHCGDEMEDCETCNGTGFIKI